MNGREFQEMVRNKDQLEEETYVESLIELTYLEE